MSASSHASGSFSTLSTLPCEFKGLLGKGPLTLALSPNRGRGKSRKLKDSPPERELWRGEQVAQEDRGRDQADQCGDENCGSNQLGTQAILLGQDEVEDRRRHRGIQEKKRPGSDRSRGRSPQRAVPIKILLQFSKRLWRAGARWSAPSRC